MEQSRAVRNSHDLALGGLGDDGQPGDLAEEAGSRSIDQGDEEKQEDGAVDALEEIEGEPFPWIKGALEEVGEDEEDVEDDGLHGVEADVAAEGGVADDSEVEGEEEEEAVEGGGAEEADGGEEGLEDDLEGRELGQDVAAVLDAIEEGVEVAGGRQDAVRGVGAGVAVLGPGGHDGTLPVAEQEVRVGEGEGSRGGGEGNGERAKKGEGEERRSHGRFALSLAAAAAVNFFIRG